MHVFCRMLILFKIIFFFKNSFRNNIKVSSSLDPDQGGHFFGPDLGPNCLQKQSADDMTCVTCLIVCDRCCFNDNNA